ncbi:hypothetical protein IFU08_07695 [Microbacterium sp. CFBP 8790]|uniref:hypothetical protein n=1 Tax=unclassified Microbacterium TaxID=2609290 RepID=UPI00177C267B|nr:MULTISPECIES: hypothetical protein [unclassified Microbacterium]MBD8205879.1 hypothetical protein [Microbacterium sp. CFBP 8801]MBD8509453.1 hypothetical protein [Microbacterium sp. CFBP 8790]
MDDRADGRGVRVAEPESGSSERMRRRAACPSTTDAESRGGLAHDAAAAAREE